MDQRLDKYMLSQDDLEDVRVIRKLGEGGNGKVDLVSYKGQELVMKTLWDENGVGSLLREARIQMRLAGAGGAPVVHGLSLTPPRMLMTSAGNSYLDYLGYFSDKDVIDSLVAIGQKLQEVHDKGVVHNDLKPDNVTVTVTVNDDYESDFHVIDYGLSNFNGDVLMLADSSSSLYWMAPEVLAGKPSTPAGDVYSFGRLVEGVVDYIEDTEVSESVEKVVERAVKRVPKERPALASLVKDLERIGQTLQPKVQESERKLPTVFTRTLDFVFGWF